MERPEDLNPYRPPNPAQNAKGELRRRDGVPLDGLTGRLLVLATFDNSVDAHLFRNELESHGIPASVNNENTTALFGTTIAGPSSAFWVEVLIMESDAERGLEIKHEWNSRFDAAEGADTIPEWTCQCGETVDEGFAICWNCGAEKSAS